ncbi:MAG: GYD domain-containing protein [Dehalococcoidia bacterium]|nr:GYD domain-containing protein [Dehalococcoidia bacterium]
MATYVLLSKLTDEGRKVVKGSPNRIEEVNKEIESYGAKVVVQFAVLGPYDFINIVQAPDNETIAKVSVELGSRGTVQIMTMPVMSISEFAEGMGS